MEIGKSGKERRMKRISCIFGNHWYKPSEIEFYLVEKKPNSNVYRSIAKCMYCGKTNEQLIEIPFPNLSLQALSILSSISPSSHLGEERSEE